MNRNPENRQSGTGSGSTPADGGSKAPFLVRRARQRPFTAAAVVIVLALLVWRGTSEGMRFYREYQVRNYTRSFQQDVEQYNHDHGSYPDLEEARTILDRPEWNETVNPFTGHPVRLVTQPRGGNLTYIPRRPPLEKDLQNLFGLGEKLGLTEAPPIEDYLLVGWRDRDGYRTSITLRGKLWLRNLPAPDEIPPEDAVIVLYPGSGE